MSDLISRADAIEAVTDIQDGSGQRYYLAVSLVDKIRSLPSADAIQGEWARKVKEYNDCDGHRFVYWYECDQCGARPPKDQWKNEWHSNFCPSCGARMKGADDE